MPAINAFCLINIFSIKKVLNLMKITLAIVIIAYFCEPTHTLVSFFNISSWETFDILKFKSFTESHNFAEVFLQLFLFFYYFLKVKDKSFNNKTTKICCWLSFIFTLLCFKRLGIVFIVAIILLEKIIDFRGKLSPKLILVFSILFTVMTVCYTQFMEGKIFTNINVYKFSTGRDYILSLWRNKGYFSYGYGTSMLVIDRYLELDLVQIYLELGILAVFAFSYSFFKFAGRNVYSFIIMLYTFMNMLTSSIMPWPLGLMIALITISIISSDKCQDEKVEIGIKKHKFKRLFELKEETVQTANEIEDKDNFDI